MTEDTQSPLDVPQMIDPDTADKGLREAAATALMAEEDPLAMAALNAQLRSSIKGATALTHALLTKLVGVGVTVVIPREMWQAPDPQTDLDIKSKRDGSVELTVKRKVNMAIRPRRR